MSNETPASKDHIWVELRYVPLIVTEDPTGDSFTVEVSDQALETADEQAMHGCWLCNMPLTFESIRTECRPKG